MTNASAGCTFSVIVPAYNVSKYLPKCLDSILAQTFSDFELIVVDDGSTDESPSICDAYAEKDPRVRVIHKQNGGLSDARNAGLDIAQGTYIYFADSDDYLMPELLEKGYEQFQKGCDVVAINNIVEELDGTTTHRVHETGYFEFTNPEERFDYMVRHLFQGKISWEVWDLIFCRSLIEKYHLRFYDNRVIFAEDQYFDACYFAHANSLISIPDELYVYVKREDSLSLTGGKKRILVGKMSRCTHEIYHYLEQYPDCKIMIDRFPLLFFSIMRHESLYAQERTNPVNCRKILKEFMDFEDKEFFIQQISLLKDKYSSELRTIGMHKHTTFTTYNYLLLVAGKRSILSYFLNQTVMDAGRLGILLKNRITGKDAK